MNPSPRLLPLLLLATLPHLHAEDLTPKARVEQFLAELNKGQVDAAYDRIFTGSAIPAMKPDALAQLKAGTQKALPVYGKPLGYDLAIEKTFGTSVVRLVYIQKFEKHPLTWEFFFYRPEKTWILSNILFNDQFNGLRGTDPAMIPKS